MNAKMNDLLTMKDFNSFLNMHPNTVYKLVKKSEIPVIKRKGDRAVFKSFEFLRIKWKS